MQEFVANSNNDKVSELHAKGSREEIKDNILNMINCPTLLTGMSHEMRTHMNSIVAFSFLMNNSGFDEKEKMDFSNHILSSCEQLMHLFDNFLDSAIIDTGNSKADFKKCKISNMLNELLTEFRVVLQREDHKDLVLVLENQFAEQTEILIDEYRLVRVIRSLFQNALLNTTTGYIKIGYYFRDGNLIFYVLDSGHGYLKCKEFLQTKNLNESLSRHNDTCSAINLTLARKLVGLMGGTVWIESNGPSGTGMYLSIPVKEEGKSKTLLNKYLNSKMAI